MPKLTVNESAFGMTDELVIDFTAFSVANAGNNAVAKEFIISLQPLD